MVRGIANSEIGFGDLILLLRYFFKLKMSTHPNKFCKSSSVLTHGKYMGFKFRKSIKILPGVRINLTHQGISSASIGKRGASFNIGKKGTRTSVGIPGSGLSYSKYRSYTENPSIKEEATDSYSTPEQQPIYTAST